jgi:cold shock CspA family protein
MDGFKTLDEGTVVEYELVNGPKGKQAERVMRVQ